MWRMCKFCGLLVGCLCKNGQLYHCGHCRDKECPPLNSAVQGVICDCCLRKRREETENARMD